MQDRPTSRELIDAVAQFLNMEIAQPLSDPRLKFRTLVAANVLTVVARELELGNAQLRAEYERLQGLLRDPLLIPSLLRLRSVADAAQDRHSPDGRGERTMREDVEMMTRELASFIRAGEADEGALHDAVFAHVEQTVIEKLRVANPRYLAKRGD